MDIQTFSKLHTAHSQSGLSIKAYCLKVGIIYTTFLYWRKKYSSALTKLKSSRSSPSPSPFVELIPGISTSTSNSPAPIKCSFGPLTIHLPHDSSAAQWRNLFLAAKEVFPC
jgi:transposase-like protein